MLITGETVKEILSNYGIGVKGVLHIGAHECEERSFYNSILGVDDENILWVDGNLDKVNKMKSQGINNIYHAVLDGEEREITFNVTDNSQASSILTLNHEEGFYNDIHIIKTVKCTTQKLSNFLAQNKLVPGNFNFWNLDIQGSELSVITGSEQLLETCDCIYTEVNRKEVYKGCGLIADLDTILGKYGFVRVKTLWTDLQWGDALYVKICKKLLLYSKYSPHHKNLSALQRMCKACSIDFEYTNTREKIYNNDYSILISNDDYISPKEIPQHVKVIYGPGLFVVPSGSIITDIISDVDKNRCVCNTLSNWVEIFFKEMIGGGDFCVKMGQFPLGIDTDGFSPSNDNTSLKINDCLLYIKHRKNDIIEKVISSLNAKGISYQIIKYGEYNENTYKSLLNQSKFMLVLDAHESQGFALQEAMSMNVPLLVLDASSMYEETMDGYNSLYENLRPNNLYSTSVPYWSDRCGIKTELTTLSDDVDKILATYANFNPREFILENLSDKVCMERIIKYFFHQ